MVDISQHQDAIAELLNAPFVPVTDKTVPGKDKLVSLNIFTVIPIEIDGFINMYPVCLGRYDIMGDGKNLLTDMLSSELGLLLASLQYIQGEINTIKENMILCPVDDPAVQYFIAGHRVERRHDDYTLAFRPMTANGISLATGETMPGKVVAKDRVMTALGFAEMASKPVPPPVDGKFEFPVYDWEEIEGYYDTFSKLGYIQGINGVESVSIIRNDSNLAGIAAPSATAHIRIKDTNGNKYKQLNLFNDMGKSGVLLHYIQASAQDKFFNAEQLLCVTKSKDDTIRIRPLQDPDETGVMVKVDYWHGEILRATYYKDDLPFYPLPDLDPNRSRFSIEHTFPKGDKVLKFYKAAGADTVIRPTAITVFDNKFRPKLYKNNNQDLIIDEVLHGFITRFTVVSAADGEMTRHERNNKSFVFAVPGDHTSHVHVTSATTSLRSENYYKNILAMVKKLGADRGNVKIYIDDLVIDGVDDHLRFETNAIGDNEKLIRHVFIIGFDENLTPLRTEIDYEDIKI